MKKTKRTGQSITIKAIIIGAMSLLMLIPASMMQGLIRERQYRSIETIEKINAKWSLDQTLSGPILHIPYTETILKEYDKKTIQKHTLNITPKQLDINAELYPEERHYGIYKSILYKSDLNISGSFDSLQFPENKDIVYHWNESYITLGVTDLRGISSNLDFEANNRHYDAEAGGTESTSCMTVYLKDFDEKNFNEPISFNCKLDLKGSSSLNFIPVGKTTHVRIVGNWKSPGFIGNFTPEYSVTDSSFDANWTILHFNRNIPEMWIDSYKGYWGDSNFGVNLVDTVDHYQQNERSAKYAFMFISLTFVVFFFVEILTKKRIHPIQYLLVAIALILFYSLLLSISEQLNFGVAYLIASIATIGLITAYAHSIFKNKLQTGVLSFILIILYTFLYVILQLEETALLIGSIGLFIILGIIMYFSRKITWYKQEEITEDTGEER